MTAPARAAGAAAPPVLEVEALRLAGATGDGAGIGLAVAPGELVVLFGPSGAGKTALLRTLLGLAPPASGRARLLGAEVARLPRAARRALLARVGVVLARDALFDDRSVGANLALALRARPRRPRAEEQRAVRESLLLVGLKHVEHELPRALAPSVRRRVALARAVAHGPELLLVDEPAGGLDPIATGAILALVAQLRARLGVGVLVATRDPSRALAIADRAAFLHRGAIAATGPPAGLAADPDRALQQLLAGRPHGPIAS